MAAAYGPPFASWACSARDLARGGRPGIVLAGERVYLRRIRSAHSGCETENTRTLDTEKLADLQRCTAHPRELRHEARQIRLGHHQ